MLFYAGCIFNLLTAGKISSNGEGNNNVVGGASGGSIVLTAAAFNGKGAINVDGGTGMVSNISVVKFNYCVTLLSIFFGKLIILCK